MCARKIRIIVNLFTGNVHTKSALKIEYFYIFACFPLQWVFAIKLIIDFFFCVLNFHIIHMKLMTRDMSVCESMAYMKRLRFIIHGIFAPWYQPNIFCTISLLLLPVCLFFFCRWNFHIHLFISFIDSPVVFLAVGCQKVLSEYLFTGGLLNWKINSSLAFDTTLLSNDSGNLQFFTVKAFFCCCFCYRR